MYFTTHQFFLSSRAVYLLVFSLVLPATEKRLEYWLESLKVSPPFLFIRLTWKARVDKATVVIVATHADDTQLETEAIEARLQALRAKFLKMYPGSFYIAKTIAVSGETNQNISELRSILQDLTCRQKQMGEEIPVRIQPFHVSSNGWHSTRTFY